MSSFTGRLCGQLTRPYSRMVDHELRNYAVADLESTLDSQRPDGREQGAEQRQPPDARLRLAGRSVVGISCIPQELCLPHFGPKLPCGAPASHSSVPDRRLVEEVAAMGRHAARPVKFDRKGREA